MALAASLDNKLGLSWAKLKSSYVEVKIEVVVKVGVESVF